MGLFNKFLGSSAKQAKRDLNSIIDAHMSQRIANEAAQKGGGNIVKANTSFGSMINSKVKRYISNDLSVDPDEIMARKYGLNSGLKDQSNDIKQRFAEAKKLTDDELVDLGLSKNDITNYTNKLRGDINDLDGQMYSPLDIASDYFFGSGSMTKTLKRSGAAIGTYGVGALGLRSASGGNATINNQGQRDIAGIPFV